MNQPKKGNPPQEDQEFGDADNTGDPGTGEGAPVDEAPGADPIEELRAEVARWQDLAMRSQADLDNYRKRMARDKEEAIKYANAALLESLLPVLDNFSLGLEAARTEESSTIYQGMAMVRKQINDFLADCGVEEIETSGTVFDPNLHEALGQEFSEDVPEGQVIREHRKGYKLKDRLLRPSKIVVSKGSPEGEE